MAKAKGQSAALIAGSGEDDLFAAAAGKSVTTSKKKQPGTIITLPKRLDPEGKLDEECQALHDAVHGVIEAKEAEDAAKNRANVSKNLLNPFVLDSYSQRVATGGCLPTTPIIVSNYKGESLTYVVQDRTSSSNLSEEQLQMLREMLGADTVARVTMRITEFGFSPEVMNEIAGEIPVGVSAEEAAAMPRVFNIVARRVSQALNEAVEEGEITAEQKASLLTASPKTVFKKGAFNDLAQFTGQDVNRIKGTLEALGSAVVRYLKP